MKLESVLRTETSVAAFMVIRLPQARTVLLLTGFLVAQGKEF